MPKLDHVLRLEVLPSRNGPSRFFARAFIQIAINKIACGTRYLLEHLKYISDMLQINARRMCFIVAHLLARLSCGHYQMTETRMWWNPKNASAHKNHNT